MRRFLIVACIGALAVSSSAVPAAARDDPLDCTSILTVQEPPQFGSFSVDLQTLRIEVAPDQVDEDARRIVDDYVLDVVAFALCVEGGVVTSRVECFLGRMDEIVDSIRPLDLDFRYVHRDPDTGRIVVDGGRLLADLSC